MNLQMPWYDEIWADVKGFEDSYEVSFAGKVRSKDRYVNHNSGGKALKKGKELSPSTCPFGYYKVTLYKDGKKYYKSVHRLVAETFIWNISNHKCVNHKDSDPSNNCALNLEWTSFSGNTKHAVDAGRWNPPVGERCSNSKLTESDIFKIRKLYADKALTQKYIAELFNVDASTISLIVNKKNWKHLK